MNFKIWRTIKKQLSSSKEKDMITSSLKRNDESKEEKDFESNVQSYGDMKQPPPSEQLAAEEAATLDRTEPIQNTGTTVEENQLTSATTSSSHDYSQDYILNILYDLPEQWIRKEMKLHIIADKKDATWVTKRVLQDVERGLITAQFTVKESNHLCDITFILKIADGLASFPSAVTAINPVLSFILTDIKSQAISRRKTKTKSKAE
jgi:hypothetical protein